MRKSALVVAVLSIACFSAAAQADLLAYWSFNNGTNLGGTSGCFQLNDIGTTGAETEYPANSGSAIAELSAWGTGDISEGNFVGPNGTNGTAQNQICSFAGTTTNDLSGTAGGSLTPVGTAENGKYFLLEIDSAITGATLTYASRGTGSGYSQHTYEYSTDNGANYSSLGTATANQTSTWSVFTVNLANIFAGTSGHESNIIRITVSGATGTNGNNRFDNIQINGTLVPEPASLGLLGLGALVLIRRRR